MAEEADLVIRGGTVADGSGGPLFEADVAVRDGKIAGVGPRLSCRGAEEIDARGLMVTPGFVDIHTHYDGQVTWENRVTPSNAHGVTTVLMGNCGVGFAPCRPGDRDRLVRLMEGVEDLPEVVLTTGLRWNWETFPDYLQLLDGRAFDADVATQIPHAALRVYAMGERASAHEAATPEDRAKMARLAGEAIAAGALGFGTSRTIHHRSSDGQAISTLAVAEAELQEIAGALASKGAGVLQAVSDFDDVEAELAMFRRLMEKSGRPLSLSVMQWHSAPDKWRTIMNWMEGCAEDGLDVHAQVSARPIGMMLGFDLSYHPFVFTPTFKKLEALPRAARLDALRQEDVRGRILSEEFDANDFPGAALLRDFSLMYPLGERPNYEPDPNSNIAAEAARRGVLPAALAYDLMLEQDGQAVLMLPTVNYARGSLDEARELWRHPRSVWGLGDGGAHLGFLCDSSQPTWMLQYWGRERAHGRMAPEEIIASLSSRPAAAIGLRDRGQLRPGWKADINILDFDHLELLPPRVRRDLPADGRRLVQGARGYRATIVSGEIVRRDDRATGVLPGQLIRGPKKAA